MPVPQGTMGAPLLDGMNFQSLVRSIALRHSHFRTPERYSPVIIRSVTEC